MSLSSVICSCTQLHSILHSPSYPRDPNTSNSVTFSNEVIKQQLLKDNESVQNQPAEEAYPTTECITYSGATHDMASISKLFEDIN